jgi:arylsulfatase A-like enzyme
VRNVLFLLVDCLRADAVRSDDRRAVTPTIDDLVARGTLFSQAISVASTTTPCVASLLTGTYSFTHGVRAISGYKLNRDCVTLPEVLKKAGYNTYAFVTGPLSPLTELDRGFDEYDYRAERTYLSDDWGARLRSLFRERTLREPWFVFLHLWEVHKPRKIFPQFDAERFGTDRYERAVSSLDPELSRLFQTLPEETMIVVHGDHGENRETARRKLLSRIKRRLGYGLEPRFHKVGHGFHVYDFLVRVPLLFCAPGLFPGGTIVPDQARQIDVFPTLVDALGLEVPQPMHGRSLMPLVRGQRLAEEPAHVEAVGTHIPDPRDWRIGLRTSKWKYAFAPENPAIAEELYDLQADPQERRNLARAQRAVVEDLKRTLLEIRTTNLTAPSEEMSEDEKKQMEERLKEFGYL